MGCGLYEHTNEQFKIDQNAYETQPVQILLTQQELINQNIISAIPVQKPLPAFQPVTGNTSQQTLINAINSNDLSLIAQNSVFSRRFVNGKTPLMYAKTAAQALLLTDGLGLQTQNGRTALMFHANAGSVELCEVCFGEAGMVDDDGKTALMYAAKKGFLEVVKLLWGVESALVDEKGRGVRGVAVGEVLEWLRGKD